jgi:two-component system CheB/CheR fusion protein
MAREGLRRALTNALHKAAALKVMVHESGLQVRTNGEFSAVDLTVVPLAVGTC